MLITGAIAIGYNMFIVRRLIGLTLRAQLAANLRVLVAATIMSALVILVQGTFVASSGGTGPVVNLALELALRVLVGAAGYVSALGLLWALSGFASGPERECLTLLRMALSRIKSR